MKRPLATARREDDGAGPTITDYRRRLRQRLQDGHESALSHSPRQVELGRHCIARQRPTVERSRPARRTEDGERLAKRDVKPDLIVSSPALRALRTAEMIANKLDYRRKDIVVNERLYAVEADDLLDVIHRLGDKVERVMLFGHNPELTELAHRLSGKITHMPTCAVAEFTFDAKSSSKIGKITPAEVVLDYPKKS